MARVSRRQRSAARSSAPRRLAKPGGMSGIASSAASVRGTCSTISRSTASSSIQPRGRLCSMAARSRQAASERTRRRRPGSESRRPFRRSPRLIRIDAEGAGVGELGEFLLQPLQASEAPERVLQVIGERQQIVHIIEGVARSARGQRPARPVGARVGLGQFAPEQAAYELRIADLRRQPGEAAAICVSNTGAVRPASGSSTSRSCREACITLTTPGRNEHARQRGELAEASGIDAGGNAAARTAAPGTAARGRCARAGTRCPVPRAARSPGGRRVLPMRRRW